MKHENNFLVYKKSFYNIFNQRMRLIYHVVNYFSPYGGYDFETITNKSS